MIQQAASDASQVTDILIYHYEFMPFEPLSDQSVADLYSVKHWRVYYYYYTNKTGSGVDSRASSSTVLACTPAARAQRARLANFVANSCVMDLLTTLRQAVMGGKDVHIEDNNVVIDGVTYPGETMTAFTSLQKNVTIIAVVLAWLNRDAKVTQYSKEAKDKKIQMIVATAMKPLQQYLMGEADAAAYLSKDFLSDAAARQATTASTSQTIEDMQSIEWAIRKEIPFKTRANVLECSRNLRDEVFRHFSMLPQADGSGPANAAAPSAGSKRPAPTSAASSAAVTSTSADDAKKRMRTSTDVPPGMRGTPIIIVPSSAASLINMYNAKQFLEGGQWVPPETARAAAGSVEKPAKIEIHRTDSRGNQCKYYVTDNVNSLQPHDWWVMVLTCGGRCTMLLLLQYLSNLSCLKPVGDACSSSLTKSSTEHIGIISPAGSKLPPCLRLDRIGSSRAGNGVPSLMLRMCLRSRFSIGVSRRCGEFRSFRPLCIDDERRISPMMLSNQAHAHVLVVAPTRSKCSYRLPSSLRRRRAARQLPEMGGRSVSHLENEAVSRSRCCKQGLDGAGQSHLRQETIFAAERSSDAWGWFNCVCEIAIVVIGSDAYGRIRVIARRDKRALL